MAVAHNLQLFSTILIFYNFYHFIKLNAKAQTHVTTQAAASARGQPDQLFTIYNYHHILPPKNSIFYHPIITYPTTQADPSARGQPDQLLAVGLKTFVPLTGLATIFRRSSHIFIVLIVILIDIVIDIIIDIIDRSALWALLIPSSRPESTRTFLAQKILWQIQLGVPLK